MIPKREQTQLDHLNSSLEQLFQQLDKHSHEQLNRQPDPATWSPLMVVKHLMLAEGYSVQYVQKKLKYSDKLPKAGIRTQWRSLILNLYFGSPFKWKAPKAIGDDTLLSDAPYELAKIKTEWLEQRVQLRALLDSFPPERYGEEIYKHPFVGRLSPTGMLRFFQGHFNRHRKQVNQRLG
jgi:hypothetical protein